MVVAKTSVRADVNLKLVGGGKAVGRPHPYGRRVGVDKALEGPSTNHWRIAMERLSLVKRLVAAGVAASAMVAVPLGQIADAGPEPPAVPTDIAVEAGNKVFLVGHA